MGRWGRTRGAFVAVLVTLSSGACTGEQPPPNEDVHGGLRHEMIAAHAYPWHLAAGAGSVWIAHRVVPTIDRIDPATDEVIDSVDLDLPLRPPGGIDELFVHDGTIWLIGGAQRRLAYRMPVDDLDDVEEIELVGYPNRFYSVAGSIWYSTSGGPKRDAADLVRLDPTTLEEIARFDVGGTNTYAENLVEVAGRVWMLRNKGTFVGGGGPNARLHMESALWEIDVDKNRIAAKRPLGAQLIRGAANPIVGEVLVFDGSIWVTRIRDRVLQEIDPVTGKSLAKIPLLAVEMPWEAQALGDHIWVGDLNGSQIARVDPSTREVQLFPTPPELADFLAAFGSIWIPVPGPDVWEDDGHVLRLTEP